MLDQMYSFDGLNLDQLSLKLISEGVLKQADNKFDYVKYRQALKGLKEKQIEESIAIQSTLTTAETMGIHVKEITESAQSFLNLINEEEQKFSSSLKGQLNTRIDSKKLEIENKQSEISSNKREIELLQKRNESLQAEIDLANKSIEENTEFIEDKKLKFQNTIEAIRVFVKKDIEFLKNKIN